jgi:hypothetical protein
MLDKRGLFEEAVNLRHVLQAGVEQTNARRRLLATLPVQIH